MTEELALAQRALNELTPRLPNGWRVAISSTRNPGVLFFAHDDGGTTALFPREDWPTNVPDYYPQPESLSASRPKAPMTPAPTGMAPSKRSPGTPVEKQGEPDTKKSRELAQAA
eukprot:8193505-Pyramimonas_sp.AAC.1